MLVRKIRRGCGRELGGRFFVDKATFTLKRNYQDVLRVEPVQNWQPQILWCLEGLVALDLERSQVEPVVKRVLGLDRTPSQWSL